MSVSEAPMLTHHRFSLRDFERMVEVGLLGPDDRVELIDGEVVEMSPIGPIHADLVDTLTRLLVIGVADRGRVRVQNPLGLPPRSQPQPDLVVARPRAEGYRTAHPSAEDVLLVIEVADSTLRLDRDVKVPLYAAQSVAEVWIVDVSRRQVLVYRDPVGDGYAAATVVDDRATVSPGAFPDVVIDVASLFGRLDET